MVKKQPVAVAVIEMGITKYLDWGYRCGYDQIIATETDCIPLVGILDSKQLKAYDQACLCSKIECQF